MSTPQDLTLLVLYGEGKEVEVKVPSEFTIDRAKKAILAKLPGLAGSQPSEYLISIAGTFLTTEFSKLGALDVVRESDPAKPLAVNLIKRIKIKGSVVSPRNAHASSWEAGKPQGTPRRYSHNSELTAPVTESSLERDAEAQELRIEIARQNKVIAEQKRTIDTLRSQNEELVRLLDAHGIPVPNGARHIGLVAQSKETTTPTKAAKSEGKTSKSREEKNENGGGGGKAETKAKNEDTSTVKKSRPVSEGAGRKVEEPAKDVKKQKTKEKEKDEKEKETKRKKFSWRSAGKKQGALMKDALANENAKEDEAKASVDTNEPEEAVGDDAKPPHEAGAGEEGDAGARSASDAAPGDVLASKASIAASPPSSPSSPAAARNTPPPSPSLASEDSRQKRNSFWRKGKNKEGSGVSKSPAHTPPSSPFPGVRFHQASPSLEDLHADQQVARTDDLTAAASSGGFVAVMAEEALVTREGRSGSGSGSGIFGKKNKKKGKESGSGRKSKDAEKEKEKEAKNERQRSDSKATTSASWQAADERKTQSQPAEAVSVVPAAGRERSESANRRGTQAFYDIMRMGAEKMIGADDADAVAKSENEDEKKNEDEQRSAVGGSEEPKDSGKAAEETTNNNEEDGGGGSAKNETVNEAKPAEEPKKPERKLTPEEHAQRIREEFIKTEEKYTQNLDILLTRYMTPLRQAAASSNEEERIITIKEVEKIFSRELSLLQTMHSHLLKEIKESTNATEFIDAFFSFVPYLKTYTLYVNNFGHSNKALSELTKSNAKLQKFIQDTYEKLNEEFVKEAAEEKMSDNQTQVDLRALLIMPIQRLPRYELLLRDLAKHTGESGAEHEKLHKLLEDVQKVNQHINEAKRKDENTNKLVEIQNAIKTKGDKTFTLFDRVGRRFVREGKLETRELHTDPTKKIPGFSRVHVFLFDDILVVTKLEKGGADAPRTYRLVEVYTLSSFTVSSHFDLAIAEVEEKDKDRVISLVPLEKDGRTIQLKAHSASDRQAWLEDISRHIQHALQRVLGGTTPTAQRKTAA